MTNSATSGSRLPTIYEIAAPWGVTPAQIDAGYGLLKFLSLRECSVTLAQLAILRRIEDGEGACGWDEAPALDRLIARDLVDADLASLRLTAKGRMQLAAHPRPCAECAGDGLLTARDGVSESACHHCGGAGTRPAKLPVPGCPCVDCAEERARVDRLEDEASVAAMVEAIDRDAADRPTLPALGVA